MAETFSIGDRVSALWGHTWYAGVVDDILDGGRAYEIAWADEETVNEVPAADVRALAPSVNEPRPKKQKVPKPRADKKTPPQKRLGASPFVEKPLAPAADESEFAYRARARRPHRRIRDDVDANDDHCSVCCDGGKLLCCATCPRSGSSVEPGVSLRTMSTQVVPRGLRAQLFGRGLPAGRAAGQARPRR